MLSSRDKRTRHPGGRVYYCPHHSSLGTRSGCTGTRPPPRHTRAADRSWAAPARRCSPASRNGTAPCSRRAGRDPPRRTRRVLIRIRLIAHAAHAQDRFPAHEHNTSARCLGRTSGITRYWIYAEETKGQPRAHCYLRALVASVRLGAASRGQRTVVAFAGLPFARRSLGRLRAVARRDARKRLALTTWAPRCTRWISAR